MHHNSALTASLSVFHCKKRTDLPSDVIHVLPQWLGVGSCGRRYCCLPSAAGLLAGMLTALIRVMQQHVRLAARAHPGHAAINPQKVSIALHPDLTQPGVAGMVGEDKSNTEPGRVRTSAVDLQHLRYAVAAADHGSFRRAADALLLRQSTLSRCIRQLEHSIGMMVFERSNGGVKTTSAGRDFLRAARSILEQMDSLVKSTHHAGRGEAGRLSVGFFTSLSAGNLRATLVDYQTRFFQTDVCLKESSRMRLGTALRNGALDIAIVTGELPLLETQGMPLWSERILLALLKEHPLASKDVVYWTDLRDETVLLSQFDPGRELEDLLMSKLVSPEDRPKIARHDVSLSLIHI